MTSLTALAAAVVLAAAPLGTAPATARLASVEPPAVSPRAAVPADRLAGVPCSVSAVRWGGVQRFWTTDKHCYASPWFAGSHPVMIHFGCNASPWYPRARACGYRGGVHHGVDLDMDVGTPIYARYAGVALVNPRSVGRAYGANRLVVRVGGTDYVLGHLSRLAVRNGQRVRAGQLLGLSGKSGVERLDGPHLHFEVRPAGASYLRAVDPWRNLGAVAR